MSQPRNFYVTTPIYYVNDQPHIGHAYTTVVADAMARFHRLIGDDVYFLTGTDEHGLKIQRAAAARGITPQALADEVVENYRRLWPALGISNNDLIRTTDDRHKAGVAALFAQIRAKTPDAIYKGNYRGLYCTGCESFYTENQLVDGGCPDTAHPGRPVEEIEESSWFFRLSAFEEPLLRLYEENPRFVMPETRLNEVRAFVKSGLKDLSISRSREKVSWGIPFPGDPEQTVYVWFDALTNYLSALGFGVAGEAPLFDRFWEHSEQRLVLHLMAKDILRFHAVYWPAFLMAAGLPLPTTIFSHGWWLKDDAKMSKSVGNVVRPWPLMEDFGADTVRWFLLREIPLGNDGSFSDEAILDRRNSDLANNIGNLFSRVTTLISKLPGGRVPATPSQADELLAAAAAQARANYRSSFEAHEPGGAQRALVEWADALNKFLVRLEPWRRAGREADCDQALATCADHLAQLTVRLHPAMPFAAARLWKMLGLGSDPADQIALGVDLLACNAWPVAGAVVAPGDAVFPRLDRKMLLAETAAPAPPAPKEKKVSAEQPAAPAPAAAAAAEPAGPTVIDYDDFAKLELRVAKVLVCEKHPNADKLLRLEIDLGGERRQLVAGIAKAYTPEMLIGKTIIVLANLKPAKLRGVESQGMLLAATGPDGMPHVLTPEGEVPPGSKVS